MGKAGFALVAGILYAVAAVIFVTYAMLVVVQMIFFALSATPNYTGKSVNTKTPRLVLQYQSGVGTKYSD